MSQGVHLRKYGVAATVDFELYEVDGVDFRTDWTPAAGDVFMMRDEAAEEQVTNAGGNADLSTLVTDEGRAYSITLALEDMQAARVIVYLVDQATKAFLDKMVIIETYGHASAQHAMDFDDADGSTLTEVGGDGAQLTAINLPNQTMDIIGSITGNLIGDVTGNVDGTVAGVTPAAVGAAMTLAADAIKAVSFDESTAWPVTASDAGATQIARVGADSDTLETLSDQIDTAQADLDTITGTGGALIATNAMDRSATLDVNTKTITNGIIVAATLGADCITNAKIADDAFAAEQFATNSLTADALASDFVDKIIDEEVDNDGTAISLRGAMKLMLAVLTGKSSGGGGATIVFRDINDSKNRISATVDANGNRTAVGTRDAT